MKTPQDSNLTATTLRSRGTGSQGRENHCSLNRCYPSGPSVPGVAATRCMLYDEMSRKPTRHTHTHTLTKTSWVRTEDLERRARMLVAHLFELEIVFTEVRVSTDGGKSYGAGIQWKGRRRGGDLDVKRKKNTNICFGYPLTSSPPPLPFELTAGCALRLMSTPTPLFFLFPIFHRHRSHRYKKISGARIFPPTH